MRLIGDLKDLGATRAFRILLGVRLISQTGDGLVQAGLATLFFFAPQNMTTASGVALALVVMLLPFSIVGPFTGPFIDRWRRRQIILHGNLARAGLIGGASIVLWLVGISPPIYALVLVTMGVNRFLLAVLAAGLPQIISPARLLTANSIVPTLGGAASALGAALGIALRLVLPAGAAQDIASLLSAVALYVLAALLVTRLAPGELGPARGPGPAGPAGPAGSARPGAPVVGPRGDDGLGAAIASTASDLIAAIRYLARRGTPALALAAMALHRFVYGLELITIILASRNLLAAGGDADAGIANFGALMGAMLAGHFLAVILTPIAHESVPPATWVVICLLGGAAGQALIAASHARIPFMTGLLLFGIGVQGAKIAVDTIVQSDTADAFRGRAFSLYDVLFNTAECLAAGAAVLILPAGGWSRPAQSGLVIMVLVVVAGYRAGMSRLGGRPRPY
ncbi:MFS transporter [Actinomyces marmotae]|uniref:MFS transporter n=1 Tax=Actinomyces marmotae TaxID=2737173 RepID=UPI001359D205|nr:MFS transporter [Actinomyces marmotae]